MSSKKTLTKKDILHMADLAKLTLSDEEIDKYLSQLEETISYVENLDELDTKNVTPTSHSVQLENVYFADGEENTKGFTQQEALKNATNKNGFFYVKRIMGN
jgi:aspartyl-tRNA(Asn)/glutamyl-tRNA(Gln) amidotransferase subunit C